MLSYRATITLSTRALNYLTDLIRHEPGLRRCRWSRLDPCRQSLLVLAHLRNGDTYRRLVAGFGVGTATASDMASTCKPSPIQQGFSGVTRPTEGRP